MNLTTDPWIPIVWESGQPDKVSLLDVFGKGDQIRDLAVRPHERIALMRLLICVAQAALDGPKDHDEWKICRERLPKAVADYLAKWKHAFELFGDGQRFLQVKALAVASDDDDAGDVSKLELSLATGNNSTLFDNAGGSGRCFDDASLALNLLTYQNYSPLVGRGYKGRSPCIEGNMLHTFVFGANVIETVWLNLLTCEQVVTYIGSNAWGKPVWELWPVLPENERISEEAISTYLGRLCPVQRAIWLGADRKSMLMGNGLQYPPFREASATLIAHGDERKPLSILPGKGIWREVPSVIATKKHEQNTTQGAIVLQSCDGTQSVQIWVGALVSDGKAKLIDVIEGAYLIPAVMFSDKRRQQYQRGVGYAVGWESNLGKAVAAYRRAIKDEIEGDMWKRGVKVKRKASSHYWTAIEQKVPLLLALIDDLSPLFQEGATKECWGATEWGKALSRAAREAYKLACPRGTPRQMKAYTLGLNILSHPVEVGVTEEESTNEEEA